MHPLITGVLFILLLVAAWQDAQNYRINNNLTIPGAALGVLLNTILPDGYGFSVSLIGWVVGLSLLLPFYLLRLMGAGDVKLMAMVGAFLGPEAVIVDMLYVMAASGVLSIIIAGSRDVLKQSLFRAIKLLHDSVLNLFTSKSNQSVQPFHADKTTQGFASRLPFGVAIAVGTIIYLISFRFNSLSLGA